MKRKVVALGLAFVLAFGLTGCGGGASEEAPAREETVESGEESEAEEAEASNEELPVIKVAVMPFANSIPVVYMVENGLDTANGFKVEMINFANGGAMNEALAADEWEIGTLSAAAVNSLAIYGAYCVADIAHSEGGLYTLCSSDHPIAKVKGSNPSYPDVYGDEETVKGITIATNTGSISHLNVIKWLEALGMTIEDVNLVSMDFPSAYQALVTGNCDVAALNPPTSLQAEAEGYVVTSSLSVLNVPQFDSIVCSAKTYNERPEIVEGYIKAFFEATDALQEDTDMAAQMLLDWYTENGSESNLEACKEEIAMRPYITSEEAKGIKIGEAVTITGEFWVSQGLLEESRFPEIATHIDDSLVKKVLGF